VQHVLSRALRTMEGSGVPLSRREEIRVMDMSEIACAFPQVSEKMKIATCHSGKI
jgi:hypothetical protein